MEPINKVSDLTSSQKAKYYSLLTLYKEVAIEIALRLTDRGKNSYSAFIDKMEALTKADQEMEEYYNSLYEMFELKRLVLPGEIVQKVADVRRKLELPAYKSKLKIRCEADFFSLFVFDEIYEDDAIDSEGNTAKVLKGYVPQIKVKPELA
jgi:hypothetical protein